MHKKKEDFFCNTLIRFRSINNNLKALKNNKLFYSTPDNFNDPYDTLIYVDYDKIAKKIKKELYGNIENYLNIIKEDTNMKEIVEIAVSTWYSNERDNTIKDFLHYVKNTIQLIQKNLRENTKVVCFSENYISMLMWSHYADNHKGFAIIYDKRNIKKAKNFASNDMIINDEIILKKVSYSKYQSNVTDEIEEYVRMYIMQAVTENFYPKVEITRKKLYKLITEKALYWNYEKEWRIIPKNMGLEKKFNFNYMYIKPKGVIIGSKCSKKNQHILIKICEEKNIPVFKVKLDDAEPKYKLKVEKYSI